ncbi:EAL domain-containing protein [Kitasatospora aburaviensis]
MRNADLAMYRAKSEGKGRVVLYTPAMRADLERRTELDERLRVAVREGGFTLLHQPVVDLATGTVTGVEAQARWRSAHGLLLTPAEFLRSAEHGDAAARFSRWLIHEAVGAAAQRCGPAGRARSGSAPVPVSVRLSAERLCSPGTYEAVVAALRDSGLPAGQLVVEVARMGSDALADELGRRLAALRRLGVSTALAGLGAGNGSLGALARLPFDSLKLDRTLVQDLGESGLGRTLAGHALRLGRDLGLGTAAEGWTCRARSPCCRSWAAGRGRARPSPRRWRRPDCAARWPGGCTRCRDRSARSRPAAASWPPTPVRVAGESGAGRVEHHHGASDLPEHRAVAGPGRGPHGETVVPPA